MSDPTDWRAITRKKTNDKRWRNFFAGGIVFQRIRIKFDKKYSVILIKERHVSRMCALIEIYFFVLVYYRGVDFTFFLIVLYVCGRNNIFSQVGDWIRIVECIFFFRTRLLILNQCFDKRDRLKMTKHVRLSLLIEARIFKYKNILHCVPNVPDLSRKITLTMPNTKRNVRKYRTKMYK